MTGITFRPYGKADYGVCLAIFDANCPEFFAPNEREQYAAFLDRPPHGYCICESDGRPLGAYGLFDETDGVKRLNWIMLSPRAQGTGIGSRIMDRVVEEARTSGTSLVKIATSPKAAAFFARFGALTVASTANGWGPGMDRVDMELPTGDRFRLESRS